MKSALMFLMVLMASFAVNAAESNVIRVDTRSSYGAKVATGIETFGRSDGSGTTSVDTRKYPDGWRTMTSGADSTSLSILNGSSVEGGIISSSVTWKPTRRYVIRDDVLLSGDALLVIRKGTEIQMTENASIIAPNIRNVACDGANFIALDGYDPNEIGLYAVTFEDEVNKTCQTYYYSAGVPVEMPAPSFPGMVFLGWSVPDSGNRIVLSYRVTRENTTLRAQWKKQTYTVRFHYNNGGTDTTQTQSVGCTDSQALLWKDSQLGWTNPAGKAFLGWGTAANATVAKYANGEKVKDLTTVGKTVDLYAVWYDAKTDYVVMYRCNLPGGETVTVSQWMRCNQVNNLVPCMATPPAGKRFAGWACSNGRRYDDGMLVFNLAQPGETVTMTAIWE